MGEERSRACHDYDEGIGYELLVILAWLYGDHAAIFDYRHMESRRVRATIDAAATTAVAGIDVTDT